MKTIYTTAIIVALTTIASLAAEAKANAFPAGPNHQQPLNFGPAGPGKKDVKPAVQPATVTPPSIDRTTVNTPPDPSQTKTDGYRNNFVENAGTSDTANVGDAIMSLMFGTAPNAMPPTAENTKGRRVPPTLKKIDQ
jgi:hypothetical protein